MLCRNSERSALFLFSTDLRLIQTAPRSGVVSVVVNSENIGKTARQAVFDI